MCPRGICPNTKGGLTVWHYARVHIIIYIGSSRAENGVKRTGYTRSVPGSVDGRDWFILTHLQKAQE